VFIVLLIIIIFHSFRYGCKKTSSPRSETLISKDTRSFYELTDGEKIQYILDNYFLGEEDVDQNAPSAQTKQDDNYISTLPTDDQTCTDNFDGCAAWAANNECIINPEYMLYNCAKSCKACALKPQDKYNLVRIYNSRDPPNCAYHGQGRIHSYPDPEKYIRKSEGYYNEDNLI